MAKIWRIAEMEVAAPADLPRDARVNKTWRPKSPAMLVMNPVGKADAASLYEFLGGPAKADMSRLDTQWQVFEKINAALTKGTVVAFQRQTGRGGSAAGGQSEQRQIPSGSSRNKQEEAPLPSRTSDKTWIDVQLLDEEGEPLKGERYILKLTDGSVREGTLGDDGRVRVNGIDPGTCTVTFPDIDAKEWWKKS